VHPIDDDIRQRLTTAHLGHLTDLCLAWAAPAWAIFPTELGDATSHFGGAPDLPEGVDWPVDADGKLANFFGQLDLSELPEVPGLARSGILSLFTPYLESAAEPVIVAPILTPAGSPVTRVEASEDDDDYADPYTGYLQPVGVRFEPIVSLPLTQKDFRAAFRAATTDEDELYTVGELFDGELEGAIGQLGGFGNPHSSDDFRRILAFHRHGRPEAQWCDYYDSREEYVASSSDGKRAEEFAWIFDNAEMLATDAAALRLLLRIDSNHPMTLSLMDWDPIYFYAPVAELTTGAISHVEAMVTQG
jgi:hypothetical protein